jgi:Lipoprotein LpqB beta-propeller domain
VASRLIRPGRPVLRRPVLRRPVLRRPVLRRPVLRRPVLRRPVLRRPVLRRAALRRAWLPLAPLAAVVVALGTGCATAPVGGFAHPLTGSSGQAQVAVVQPVPGPGPLPHWSAGDVVKGFLHASASFATDPSAARAYLAPGIAWNPPGTVTVVNSDLSIGNPTYLHVAGQTLQRVTVTGQPIATLSSGGQYSYDPSGPSTKFVFTLIRSNGQLRIDVLPQGTQLLLTQSDFDEVFQPQDLYFFSKELPGELVPDPVVAPTADAATGLVNGLIHDSPSWLSGATTNAFPARTRLIGPVTVSNQVAVVNLGGTAASASPGKLTQMYEQLVQTLTTPEYGSSPVANSVTLEIDGRPRSVSAPANPVPSVGSGSATAEPLYFASDGAIRRWAGGKTSATVPGIFGSPGGVTAVAVTTTGSEQVAAATEQHRECVVQVAASPQSGGDRDYDLSPAGGPCTSLSWDGSPSLWAVSGGRVWVIQPGSQPNLVSTSATGLASDSRIISVQMAPDSVRAALLVRTGQVNQVFLAAVQYTPAGVTLGMAVPVGTDLAAPGPVAISWYSSDYLVAAEGTSLFEVPLSGGASKQLLGTVPGGTVALSSAGLNSYGAQVAVATQQGQVFKSVAPYISWTVAPQTGSVPALPG